MSAKVTFYPLCKEGARPPNAETFRIDLANGRQVLVDYANMRDPDNRYDLRCDLPAILRADLRSRLRSHYDVVMFTHLDDDHVRGAGEFFSFERYANRQGADRVEMRELWVPAAAVVESGLENDAELIRAEARYRLKRKEHVRVFSAPDTLADWCRKESLDLAELKRLGLVIDAGRTVPGFTTDADGLEFFVHSPFASRTEDGTVLERNKDAIVMQATFTVGSRQTLFLITADVTHAELDDIVRMTTYHQNEKRLQWDILDIPHHCSYTGIGPDKGVKQTTPSEGVRWIHKQGGAGAILVSSSCVIPTIDTEQPPHRQAASHYRAVAAAVGGGEFVVTMEHPSKSSPGPLVITITDCGAAVQRAPVVSAGGGAVGAVAPRVG